MLRIAIDKEIFKWLLERANTSVDSLKDSFPKIQDWIEGETHPTLNQLNKLAKRLHVPLGFFFLKQPFKEELPVPLYRTNKNMLPSKPSLELLDTIRIMQRRQMWMRDYLIRHAHEPLSFVKSVDQRTSYKKIARLMRETLNLKENWKAEFRRWEDAFRFLRDAMEEIGILVFINSIVENNTHRKLNYKEFRGFVLIDEYAPLVFVNSADSKAAQMFTLAHELAHVFLGKSGIFDLREMHPADDPLEEFCDKVAAEFLVPEDELRAYWAVISNKSNPFDAVARHFKVSSLVAARRAKDLGLVSKARFFSFYNRYMDDYKEREAKERESEKIIIDPCILQYYRIGKRFPAFVIHAVKSEEILYTEAYELTGLSGKVFEKYAKKLGYEV